MISARAADVAAMPIHGPFTRQMRSFGNLINASIKRWSGSCPTESFEKSPKSCVKSFPELKVKMEIMKNFQKD